MHGWLRQRAGQGQRGGVLLWLIVLLLLGVVLLVLYVARAPLLWALADWWIVDEPLEKAQAIVVLGDDNAAGDRLRHAVELYRDGWAPRLVLSGAGLRRYFNEVELMQQEAMNWGLPGEHLVAAPHTSATLPEEALALHRVLAEHNFRRVILVTSNYQTRRVRRVFRMLYRPRATQVIVSAADDSDFEPRRWWKQPGGCLRLLVEVERLLANWWEARSLA